MRGRGSRGAGARAGLAALLLAAGACDGGEGAAEPETGAAAPGGERPVVALETSEGEIHIELLPERAPRSVENFLAYVDEGFYDGTIFHRVIPGFMIQGGGFTEDLERKETRAPVPNEAEDAPANERGTVAMARSRDPDSATAQFFVNVEDNAFLDAGERGAGYAVFGRVVEGMEVVDRIAQAETAARGAHQDVPVEPVVIESARRVESGESSGTE